MEISTWYICVMNVELNNNIVASKSILRLARDDFKNR